MKVEILHTGFKQELLIDNAPSYLKICPAEMDSPGFTTRMIPLSASPTSKLKWEESIQKGNHAKEAGKTILWHFEYGPCTTLKEEMAFLAVEIALDHFSTVIWEKFRQQSIGILLFKGTAREYVEYEPSLKLLASRLPDEVPVFVLLDAQAIKDPFSYFSIVRQDLFGHFFPIIKGKWMETFPLAFPALAWDHGSSPFGFFSAVLQEKTIDSKSQPLAILLPESHHRKEFDQVIEEIKESFFRVIPPSLLTQEWEGIEDLIVFAKDVTPRTKRNLLGFSASGGRVISIGGEIT